MRRAKIVCTLGPAVSTPEKIRALVDAGMDVARLNLSHGSHADHEKVYEMVRRRLRRERPRRRHPRRPAGSQDPARQGGRAGRSTLEEGAAFTITTRDVPGDAEVCSTTYDGLPGDVAAGDQILIDDGKVRLEVTSVDGHRRAHPRRRPRADQRQQGHQPARRRRLRAGAVREGQGGPALGAAPHRRLHRAVVRALRRRRRGRARRSCARRASSCPSSRRSRSRRRSTTSTRSSTPSTASWWRAATSAWSARSRTCRSCRSRSSTWPGATPSR